MLPILSDSQIKSAIQLLLPYIRTKRLQKFVNVLSNRSNAVQVVLENLKHPLNGAACLRTADGFGIQNFHFIQSSFKNNVDKVSTGVNKWINIHHHRNIESCVEYLKRGSYTLVGISQDSKHTPSSSNHVQLSDVISDSTTDFITGVKPLTPSAKIALILGNETGQISNKLSNCCDYHFKVNSSNSQLAQDLNLNLASALTILNQSKILRVYPDSQTIACLSDFKDKIFFSTNELEPLNNTKHPLTVSEKNIILLCWLVKTTPHSKKILKYHNIIGS
ncbi:alpha/beta knot [Conidiobolus coronatus NRRL 28638]|uniref:Alpha/beta knot n=1 Tax=Conidiobolus coronatus (strain ATCC 28846 / CBS 209.66 / NRRL 28638) TaxID=796925 RepID=A0A137P3I3_CONC2|nr:alpha/beta knot [Conidiobolus coronatus NRRL 28638]|eukprot:KXN69587.1 alpha/beta knot [Conidiobolus coronatus NRRL 28638]